jgi:hypothetical protein
MLLSYPRFALHMALLFPLEVWSRLKPWFFIITPAGMNPRLSFYLLAGLSILYPGGFARLFEIFARELVITVRSQLRPLTPSWRDDIHSPTPANNTPQADKLGTSPLKPALAIILIILLLYISYLRVQQGMLTWETGKLALISILRFAVLPFILASAIIRSRAFRRLSLLN